jgi:phage tail tape-measure protein
VVDGGLALIDDVGKVERGEMTGGHATVDVGVKAGVGIAAGIAGAEAGAAIGAAVGSVIPVAGTAVGFVAGAVVGAGVGYVAAALTETETSNKIVSAAGDAVDAGIDEAKKVGSAVSWSSFTAVCGSNTAVGAVSIPQGGWLFDWIPYNRRAVPIAGLAGSAVFIAIGANGV